MRWTLLILVFVQAFASAMLATPESRRSEKVVSLTLPEASFFTDRLATAVVYFDSVVEQPEDWPRSSDACDVVDLEVIETPDDERYKSAVILRLLPKEVGVVTLPSFEFESADVIYRTEPQQILVIEPARSDLMSLSLKPAKRQVYVGEPLRIDLRWDCGIEAEKLRAVNLSPEFFQDPAVQVVIPRNTDPEELQVGFPIGGRRVIARRSVDGFNEKALGAISLPLMLRFNDPGRFVLPATRLDCAVLAKGYGGFGRYAAHFNNGLFEAVDREQRYQRVYTTAAPIEIEVLPLPGVQAAAQFSGLFEPVQIDVSVDPDETVIGDLVDLEIKLSGAAPHGMLDLPRLSQQAALRERFIVDDNYGRLWHGQGTIFRTRFRVLSTSVAAFPSLKLQTFDSETGQFVTRTTEAIPLMVDPRDGQDFLSLKSFQGAAVPLTNQPEGIWHNMKANPMNDLFNALYAVIHSAFWLLLLLGPLAFVLLLPVVRRWRRRALDPAYRSRVEAYAEFKRCTADPRAKWSAFLRFMALTFEAGDKAWTLGDSKKALRHIDADQSDIDVLAAMHHAADAEDFSERRPQAEFKNLDSLAKRISQLAAKGLLCGLLCFAMHPYVAQADEWAQAEALFLQAQSEPAGSELASQLYSDAALKFQAVAKTNQRSGKSWYNAGNAWFQAGALGRSIAAYRQAELYRPFDSKVIDNLAAARAMALNDVPDVARWWERIPLAWLKILLVLLNLVFWGLLLLTLRYQQRGWFLASGVSGVLLLLLAFVFTQKSLETGQAGVVVVDVVYGKKGPGYAYANAFNEALHDGLEFALVETREDWSLVELPDTRQCWVPTAQVELFRALSPQD